MNKQAIYLDSFSGAVVDLKKKDRTKDNVLRVLKEHPRVSTFDMCENVWLCNIVKNLESEKLIKAEKEGYPWHRWSLTKAGQQALNKHG